VPKFAAVIVAAGSGSRFGQEKQSIKLEGRPLYQWAVDAFKNVEGIEHIVLVCSEQLRSSIDDHSIDAIRGGATRQESVYRGVTRAKELGADHVLVHDAARALITSDIITRVMSTTEQHGAAIAAVPVVDTIKEVDGSIIQRTVPREKLWRAQTPQGASIEEMLSAYKSSEGRSVTDEAELLETVGISARVVPGSEDNFKITFPEDLERAREVLLRRKVSR
jgi:2-C-methyl-D-erythritol 4-phosphate cytidylyltransferase / 2-C-methyl-D-erythritol 2,4-cyclodiphosphate synthase